MPITPVHEQPPVTQSRNGIDWTEQLAALVDQPGEWFKVDGPFGHDKNDTSIINSHRTSLRKFGEKRGHDIEIACPKVPGDRWLYARLVVEDQAEPEPEQPEAKAAHSAAGTAGKKDRPVAVVPDPPRSPAMDDLGDDALTCDECGDKFRTNVRLRQHQANAHKAS